MLALIASFMVDEQMEQCATVVKRTIYITFFFLFHVYKKVITWAHLFLTKVKSITSAVADFDYKIISKNASIVKITLTRPHSMSKV